MSVVDESNAVESQVSSPESVDDGSLVHVPQPEAADDLRTATEQPPETEMVEGEAVAADAATDEPDVQAALADDDDTDDDEDVQPLELIDDSEESDDELEMAWYILKVQVNRESSICDALQRNVKREGLERYFTDILVPTEDVREFTKSGKQRVVKRKLYPGYILVNMAINDDTWFLVRETPGIGDFTGSAGKPAPMPQHEIDRILKLTRPPEDDESKEIKSVIKFKSGDRVRVKEGTFQNLEGEVDTIDETRGRITVMLSVFGRPTPVELEHWQVEDI